MRKLSMVIPVHFTTGYREGDEHGQPVYVTWWQWRSRIFRYRKYAL